MTEPQRFPEKSDRAGRPSPLAEAWRSLAPDDQEHPDDEMLAAYTEGSLRGSALAACEKHLSACPPCLDLVSELWAYSTAAAATAALSPKPVSIGRRRLLRSASTARRA